METKQAKIVSEVEGFLTLNVTVKGEATLQDVVHEMEMFLLQKYGLRSGLKITSGSVITKEV